MPSAYGGTDIISYLQRKYIIRQRRISYRASDISLGVRSFYFCYRGVRGGFEQGGSDRRVAEENSPGGLFSPTWQRA